MAGAMSIKLIFNKRHDELSASRASIMHAFDLLATRSINKGIQCRRISLCTMTIIE